MKLAYFDCFAGAAGDMIVGALLDAGLDFDALEAALGTMDLANYELSAETVRRGALAATKFDVAVGEQHHHRGLADIEAIIDSGDLPGGSADTAKAVFARLAAAEAKVHGVSVEEVHFHEVGAVDSIVDIVATAVGLEMLGIEQVYCSAIPTGSGTVETAHGTLPIPAPATAELLIGAPVAEPVGDGPAGEMTTPTAAAILTTLAAGYGLVPAMELSVVGCGAGTRESEHLPNVVRVLIGEAGKDGDADSAVELAVNLDDCTGEVIGATIGKLLAVGAMDAWASPAVMKKSRPAWVLSVLCGPGDAPAMEEILFVETTTLGVRRRACSRTKLIRRHETVETPYGAIRVKIGARAGTDVTASPEFADAAAAAEANGVSIKEVLAAAVEAYRRRS